MEWIKIIMLIVACALGTFVMYGIWANEVANDEFRKKYGYKPKYHDWNKNDENQDQ